MAMTQRAIVKRIVMVVKNKTKILSVTVILLVSGYFTLTQWDVLPSQKQTTRAEFIEVFQSIALGEQVIKVKTKFDALNKKLPKLTWQDSPSDLKLLAPAELPNLTTSWILIAQIKNGVVVGKGIRVYEGWYRPCDAPIDEGEIKQSQKTTNNKSCL